MDKSSLERQKNPNQGWIDNAFENIVNTIASENNGEVGKKMIELTTLTNTLESGLNENTLGITFALFF